MPLSPRTSHPVGKLKREIIKRDVENQMDITENYRIFSHKHKKNIISHHLMESSPELTLYLITKKTSTDAKKNYITSCILLDNHR